MVVISSPDYFHHEHLKCVVEAGKHVYCEKPAAVDVAGCQRFIEIGKQAQGRLSLEVGFQVRCAPPFSEMVGRVHQGAIGKVACASTYYHAPEINYPPRPNASPLEVRIRNFYWDRVLSGDVILDQNIHVIDICSWVIERPPTQGCGDGRTECSPGSGQYLGPGCRGLAASRGYGFGCGQRCPAGVHGATLPDPRLHHCAGAAGRGRVSEVSATMVECMAASRTGFGMSGRLRTA